MAWASLTKAPGRAPLRLYYDRAGTGAPVVYVHGGFASLATRLGEFSDRGWREGDWELDFARRFDFVSYERRGCYRSDAPRDGYDPATQAGDLAALLDALDIESAHLVGSSAGGLIATLCAAAHPSRVRSLVLAGTALQLWPPDDPYAPIVRAVWDVLLEQGPDAAFDARPAGVESTYDVLWGHVEPEARGRLDEFRARIALRDERARALPRTERVRWHEIELRNLIAYIGFDARDSAAGVRCPTLVLHGSDDRDVPLSLGRALADAIPGASLHVMDGGGHSLVHRSTAGRAVTLDWIAAQEEARAAQLARESARL
jgi:pimeloyl-ACP methyl ester carboxylesterase